MAPKRFWIYVTMTWALALATPDAYAQSRTIGAVISYTGVAVSLETPVSEKHEDVFLELNLKAECNEFYAGRSEYPRVSASASWNYILKQWKSDGDNMVNLFAGPGLTVGYLQDYKAPDGLLFGL